MAFNNIYKLVFLSIIIVIIIISIMNVITTILVSVTTFWIWDIVLGVNLR